MNRGRNQAKTCKMTILKKNNRRKIKSPHNTNTFLINNYENFGSNNSFFNEYFEEIESEVGGSMTELLNEKLILEASLQQFYTIYSTTEPICFFRVNLPVYDYQYQENI